MNNFFGAFTPVGLAQIGIVETTPDGPLTTTMAGVFKNGVFHELRTDDQCEQCAGFGTILEGDGYHSRRVVCPECQGKATKES